LLEIEELVGENDRMSYMDIYILFKMARECEGFAHSLEGCSSSGLFWLKGFNQ